MANHDKEFDFFGNGLGNGGGESGPDEGPGEGPDEGPGEGSPDDPTQNGIAEGHEAAEAEADATDPEAVESTPVKPALIRIARAVEDLDDDGATIVIDAGTEFDTFVLSESGEVEIVVNDMAFTISPDEYVVIAWESSVPVAEPVESVATTPETTDEADEADDAGEAEADEADEAESDEDDNEASVEVLEFPAIEAAESENADDDGSEPVEPLAVEVIECEALNAPEVSAAPAAPAAAAAGVDEPGEAAEAVAPKSLDEPTEPSEPDTPLHRAERVVLHLSVEINRLTKELKEAKSDLKEAVEEYVSCGGCPGVVDSSIRTTAGVASTDPKLRDMQPPKPLPSSAVDDNSWRSIPTVDVNFEEIDGMGAKKLEMILADCPTVGQLEDVRADTFGGGFRRWNKIGRDMADRMEDKLLDFLTKNRDSALFNGVGAVEPAEAVEPEEATKLKVAEETDPAVEADESVEAGEAVASTAKKEPVADFW